MKADNCGFKSNLMIFYWLDEFCWYFCLTAAQWTNMPITSTPSMNGHKNSRELSRAVHCTARESEPVYSIISVLFFHDEQQQESSYSNPPTNISVILTSKQKSPCNPEFLWSWMRTVGHHFTFSSLEKIYTKLFSLYFSHFCFLVALKIPFNAYSITL